MISLFFFSILKTQYKIGAIRLGSISGVSDYPHLHKHSIVFQFSLILEFTTIGWHAQIQRYI